MSLRPVTGARQQPWPMLVPADRRDAAKTGEWPVDITYATPPDDAAGSSGGGASGSARIAGVTAHLDRRGGGDGGGRSRVPRHTVVPLEREPDGRAFTATAWLPAAVHTLEFHVVPAPVAEGEERAAAAGGDSLMPPPGADHGWAPRRAMDGAAVSEPPLLLVVSPLGGRAATEVGGDEEGEPGEATYAPLSAVGGSRTGGGGSRVRAATAALEAVEAAAAARAAEDAASRAATSRKEVTWGAPVAEDASGSVKTPSADSAAGLVATLAPEPVNEPVTGPVDEPTTQPLSKLAVKPSPTPLFQPAAASVARPATMPVVEPLRPPPSAPLFAKAGAPHVATSAVATIPSDGGRGAKPAVTGGDAGGGGGSGGDGGRGNGSGGGRPLLALVRLLMVGAGVVGGFLAGHAALTHLTAADGPDGEEEGGVDGGWKSTPWPAVGVPGGGRRRDSFEKECELYNRSELRD